MNIVFAGIVGLLVLTVVKVINVDELAIDPVTLPKALKDLGFTEEGVALSLSDNMFKIFETSDVYKRTFNVKAKIEEGDFAIPVAGLRANTVPFWDAPPAGVLPYSMPPRVTKPATERTWFKPSGKL